MREHIRIKGVIYLLTLLLTPSLNAISLPHYDAHSRYQPIRYPNAMIACAEPQAVKEALSVLKRGGNAIDAAVTLALSLAVTSPQAGNLGGGGFMLIYLAQTKKVHLIDYREKAPSLVHRNLFLNKKKQIDREKTQNSYLASGVPGTVSGLSLALKKYGTISWKDAIKPAIQFAKKGIVVDEQLHRDFLEHKKRLIKHDATKKIFIKSNNTLYEPGEILIQQELAWSLEQLSKKGPETFYRGEIGDRIHKSMKDNGGLITKKDLVNYEAIQKEPIKGTYRDHTIYSMGPPSSGGIHIVQILNILEGFPLSEWGHNSAKTLHVMTEAMKRAYVDRAKYLGDDNFTRIPKGITSKEYANDLRKKINLKIATPKSKIKPGKPFGYYESHNTNHFSIVDPYGNIVSNTYTLNFPFGSGIVIPGTGILMNNEMDDFAAKEGESNAYGLIGGSANLIAPNKKMLSSMAPTLVMKEDKPFLVTGSPGGSRIITSILQVISNVIDHKMNVAEATNAARVHHQWSPNTLYYEQGISPDTLEKLKKMGHKVEKDTAMGGTQSILIEKGWLYGSSDPRKIISATTGF